MSQVYRYLVLRSKVLLPNNDIGDPVVNGQSTVVSDLERANVHGCLAFYLFPLFGENFFGIFDIRSLRHDFRNLLVRSVFGGSPENLITIFCNSGSVSSWNRSYGKFRDPFTTTGDGQNKTKRREKN